MNKPELHVTTHRPFTTDAEPLAALATFALLAQEPVRLTLPDGWTRPKNFPLPMVAHEDSRDREYRPLAVLEWVNDELRAEVASKAIRERAEKEVEAAQ